MGAILFLLFYYFVLGDGEVLGGAERDEVEAGGIAGDGNIICVVCFFYELAYGVADFYVYHASASYIYDAGGGVWHYGYGGSGIGDIIYDG